MKMRQGADVAPEKWTKKKKVLQQQYENVTKDK